MVTYSDSDFEVIETPSPPKRMADESGLSALVSNPEARPRLSAVEREAAERQRDRARREQGMQMLETDALRSDENSLIDLSKAGEALSGIWEDMPWYDQAALSTALVPIVGDVVGLGADAITLAKEPSLANLGWLGAGLLPWVPSGGIMRAGRKAAAHKAFTNLRNYVPGIYGKGVSEVGKAGAVAKTTPEGLVNIIKARTSPHSRALQKEFNISVADQRASRKALKVSEKETRILRPMEKKMRAMKKDGSAYTDKTRVVPSGEDKGKVVRVETEEFKKLAEDAKASRSRANDAGKKAMGQLNQSRSMTKQYFGPNSGLEGLLQNIGKVDHIANFKTLNVNDYFETVGGLVPTQVGREGVDQIFKQIKTLPAIGYNPKKNYQMNIRRVHTGSAGELDPGMGASMYPSSGIGTDGTASLTDIKREIFSKPIGGQSKKLEGKTYRTTKEFLEKLDETGIKILNRDEILKGMKERPIRNVPAVITGSRTTDAYELGGANYMTAVSKDGRSITILNDEHDLLSNARVNKILKKATLGRYEDQLGKLPGGDRYMNVSEPIVLDLTGNRATTKTQRKTMDTLDDQKKAASKKAIEEYETIPGVDVSGIKPEGFKTIEQWARAQAVAKIRPSHKDYSRIIEEYGMFAPMRAVKPLIRDEDKKAGGSVIERNPYDYPPRAI